MWQYLKVEREYRHHPARGRLYMLDDAASRKSSTTMLFDGEDGAPLEVTTQSVGEIGPAQKSREKDASQGSRYGKVYRGES